MKNKPILPLLLTAALLFHPIPVRAMTVRAENSVRTYNGEFTDISSSAWYYEDVVEAYSRGLLNGKTASTFAPDQTLSIAETIKLAALCHQILSIGYTDDAAFESASSDHWYDGYVSYSMKNGIVTEEYDDYSAAASRAQVAVLFSRAIIASGKTAEELNTAAFGDLPDVPTDMWYAGAVYRMYRWGILTGDNTGAIHPEAKVKRREAAALCLRMIDETRRVKVGAVPEDKEETLPPSSDSQTADPGTPAPDTPPQSGTEIAPGQTPAAPPAESNPPQSEPIVPTLSTLTLYTGSSEKKSFTGITGFAGSFSVSDGSAATEAGYSLDLINHLVLEPDNISFRLYTGSGFEALGIVRGWMNEAARGKDGAAIREKADVYEKVNDLCYLWINGNRVVISELWYADHGEYTTYAFYFDETIDPGKVTALETAVGRLDKQTLLNASLSDLADRIEKTAQEPVPELEKPALPEAEYSDTYLAAVADAKGTAAEILFEFETKRCQVLYGRGLYGRESDEYRLLFIFRDGTTQTVAAQKLENIRINTAGTVLYYNMTGPDGKILQYGINFGE
ncbi:MAG: S-layer homology domain-containing protein [Clostridia bacterium]|nr:S-layer homology domain-containing protein [Clostridia bacterium]